MAWGETITNYRFIFFAKNYNNIISLVGDEFGVGVYRKDLKNEFYTRKAKKEGYPARSVYKLKEIDEKYKIIKKGDIVLDLGAAPGSWILYVSRKVGKEGRVLGIDVEDLNLPIHGNILFMKRDVLRLDEIDFKNMGGRFDVVVADLAPKTSGIVLIDVGKSLELSRKSLEIAKMVLKIGGNFICKIFEGEGVNDFVKEIEKSFKILKRVRPLAVIKKSKEFYVVAKGFGARECSFRSRRFFSSGKTY